MGKKLWFFLVTTFLLALFPLKAHGASMAENSAILASATPIVASDTARLQEAALHRKKAAIRKVLEEYNSPMIGSVDAFMDACMKYNLDCYLLPSIAGLESTFGEYTWPGTNNPFGWGRGMIGFKDWNEAIDTVGKGLRENYIDAGAVTIEQIGARYCEGNTWAGHVRTIMSKFEREEQNNALFFSADSVQL